MSHLPVMYQENVDDSKMTAIKPNKPSRLPTLDLSKLEMVDAKGKKGKITDVNQLITMRRLIVIVPNEEVDEASFSRQVWTLASNFHLNILLLSVVTNENESMSAIRRLTTLATMIHDSFFRVEKQVIFSRSWLVAIKRFWQQTDMILCPAEVKIHLFFRKSVFLCEYLGENLKTPLYTFSGLYTSNKKNSLSWLGKLPYWVGFLLIMVLSFYFEANVDQVNKGWLGQVLLMMIVIIEIGLIYLWTLISG